MKNTNPDVELTKGATLNAAPYDKTRKAKVTASGAVLIGILWMLGSTVTAHYGTKIPGSRFERDNYEGLFYVNLFPDGQKVKSYRVPAMVSANYEASSSYTNSNGDEQDVYEHVYRIQYAVMLNGGKVHFDNSYGFQDLELNKTVTLYDDDKRYWGIELTNRSVDQSAQGVK